MFSSKAIAIRDEEVQAYIDQVGLQTHGFHSPAHFVKKHRQWLLNNNFYVEGLDRFKYGHITAGCTEAFNEVYKEPCYVLKGEYTYHRDSRRAIETSLHNIPFNFLFFNLFVKLFSCSRSIRMYLYFYRKIFSKHCFF